MRRRLMIPALMLLMAPAGIATAQQDPLPATPLGTLDVGIRASNVDGDAARFQRYQDIRDVGAGLNVTLAREGPTWAIAATARNVGYLDQLFRVSAATGRLKASFEWNQFPLYYSGVTSTAYLQTSPGTFTLDPGARTAVQNGTAMGIPLSPSQADSASIYRGMASPFDLRARRDTLAVTLAYAATRDLSLTFALDSHARSGAQPWGGGFAFSALPEVPRAIDDRTTNILAGAEWATRKGMLRIGYEGSYFSNKVETLTWDNPVRATNYNQNTSTVTGYDPLGYVTRNGAATGRMALEPSNHTHGINGLGLIKLPWHSSVNAAFAVVGMNQNAALIPWTTNAVIADPKVYASFPGLATLGRPTAQVDVRQMNANVAFTTRPNQYFGLTARYRYFSRDDRTPAFDATDYVLLDAAPEHTGSTTAYLDLTRNTVNVDATITPVSFAAFRVGVGRDFREQAPAAYATLTDTTLRASVDTVGSQYLTLRALYEHTQRDGSDFDADYLTDHGTQPASRSYDNAGRNRDRTTALVDITPVAMLAFNVSAFAGRDTYDDATQEFGLLNNDHTGYNIGLWFTPTPALSLGAQYGYERYSSLQRSRSASAPPDPSWTDPQSNWNLDNDETINSVSLTLDLINALPRTELRVAYDWMDSNQGFAHSGPRVDSLAALNRFIPLIPVTSTWQRATVDLRHFFTAKVGVGVGYWFDKYEVNDFATIDLSDGTPRTDYIGSLMLGYGYRPFEANTGFVRLLYRF